MFIGKAELGLGLPGIPKGARFHISEDTQTPNGGPKIVPKTTEVTLPLIVSTDTRTFKVLFVDDWEPSFQSRTLFNTITFDKVKISFEVTPANNGKEGLEIFRQGTFDLVVTDFSMPEMNGIELAREIRKLNKDIPIVLFTGHSSNEFRPEEKEYFTHIKGDGEDLREIAFKLLRV